MSSSSNNLNGLSFLFCTKELQIVNGVEARRYRGGLWCPPRKKGSFRQVGEKIWLKWKDGRVERVQGTFTLGPEFGAVTIFTQHPEERLVAVNFDTTKKDVSLNEHTDWPGLHFKHKSIGGKVGSLVDPYEDKRQLAAPASSNWMPQILPTGYRWTSSNGGNGAQNPESGGLAGKLPVLLALAAFAARPSQVKEVMLNAVRPNRWVKQQGLACGRSEATDPYIVLD